MKCEKSNDTYSHIGQLLYLPCSCYIHDTVKYYLSREIQTGVHFYVCSLSLCHLFPAKLETKKVTFVII